MLNIKQTTTICALLLVLLLWGCHSLDESRSEECLNGDWHFIEGYAAEYVTEECDDSEWGSVDLAHTWSSACDSVPVCGACYRKHFTSPLHHNRVVNLEFESLSAGSTIYVNGLEVGNNADGKESLSLDITPYVRVAGQSNLLAVCGDSTATEGGIGGVRMVVTSSVYIEHAATTVTTVEANDHSAVVNTVVRIANKCANKQNINFVNTIHDAEGKRERKSELKMTIAAGESFDVEMTMQIPNPVISYDDSHYEYKLRSAIEVKNYEVDVCSVPFIITPVIDIAETEEEL